MEALLHKITCRTAEKCIKSSSFGITMEKRVRRWKSSIPIKEVIPSILKNEDKVKQECMVHKGVCNGNNVTLWPDTRKFS